MIILIQPTASPSGYSESSWHCAHEDSSDGVECSTSTHSTPSRTPGLHSVEVKVINPDILLVKDSLGILTSFKELINLGIVMILTLILAIIKATSVYE